MATCACTTAPLTIKKYLEGKVRNIAIPDNALLSICVDAEVDPDMYVSDLTQKQRDLCLAWTYVWIAGSPTQTGSTTDEDADWKHTEGGERMSASSLKQYLSMANDIFDKYDLPLVGEEKWGFVGHGIRNPRNYNPR
jgi:hypothetical protein